MALFKRGKVWWARFTAPNGKQVRQSARTADRKEAQEYHDRLKASYWRTQVLKERPRRKWQEAVERWLIEKEGEKASLSADKQHLRWVHGYLYGIYLDEIDRDVLDRIVEGKRAAGVSNATVNRLLEVVRAVLRRAQREWGWLETAPHVRLLAEPQRRVRWLSREESARLLTELPGHLAEMARFSLATGLREGNVAKLEWSQVDLANRRAWIHPDQAKARKAIAVPLNRDAMVVLRRQQGKHRERVFTYLGLPIGKANGRAWRQALVRAGIENFRWHDLRHTWATWHVQSGTPLHVLQELGGWSSYAMVMRYAHLSADHLAEHADRLADLSLVSTNSAQSGVVQTKKRHEVAK